MQNEFLSENTTRIMFKQLLAGMTYLHDAQKICHRDVKLDNIFLTRELRLKIGDFGAASKFDPKTKLTYRCGTTQVRDA
jgi:serine/threonine protein kinase